jgi:hypothetical protein
MNRAHHYAHCRALGSFERQEAQASKRTFKENIQHPAPNFAASVIERWVLDVGRWVFAGDELRLHEFIAGRKEASASFKSRDD